MKPAYWGAPEELTPEAKRAVACQRASELKERIADYLAARDGIPSGFAAAARIERNKFRLMAYFGASEHQWQDWRWQLKNRITTLEPLRRVIELDAAASEAVVRVSRTYRWSISPYYASLLGDTPDCPARLQSLPSPLELEDGLGQVDPMAEEFTAPAPGVTRRYPDRLIINVTNQCAMYCRHCQRRRNIGEVDQSRSVAELEQALAYVRANPEIRDVLLTGGDALMLSDERLEWLLAGLSAIPHVEVKRLGTRAPVTLPQRVTPELARILAKYPPIFLNTQFNHPLEITPAAKAACDLLVGAGVLLGNQAVLLKGVNDHPFVMRKLNQELLKIRVRPYYIFHAKQVRGTTHFVTSIEKGLEIMDKLRGYTSGLAVPTYIVNAPHGYGKVPLLPHYLTLKPDGQAYLRTWEKRLLPYPNHQQGNSPRRQA